MPGGAACRCATPASRLGTIAAELTELEGDLVHLAKATGSELPERIPLRLVPTWDAYLLGWKKRSFLIAAEHVEGVFAAG